MATNQAQFCMECGTSLPEGAKFCAECGTRVPIPSDAPEPTATAGPSVPPAPDIPPALRAKFEEAQKELRGDRREVVVLFADLKGFTSMSERLDPEEVSLIMQRLLGELAAAVHRYEGYVDKYIGDAIMALFGAPLAHENDAERAVLAALEMLESVARRNEKSEDRLSLRVGLNLGDVVAADMGTEGRVQYTVMGDTVNVASRLEGAAQPDTILISQSVHDRIAHRFEIEEIPPVTVKGKSEPLRVHRVKGLRASTDSPAIRRSAFVGREREMEILLGFLNRIAAGNGDALLIEADAGAGKSRLIAEGIDRSAAEEKVIEIGFTQIQIPGQISPAAELFRNLVGIRAGSAGEALGRAEELLGASASQNRAGVLGLANHAFHGGALEADEDPRVARQNRWLALVALLGAVSAGCPVVIVVEDIHWADEEGQEFLSFLSAKALTGQSVGFIFTARTGGRPEWLDPRFPTLTLEALGEEAALSILGSILDTLRPSVRREIIRRSQGNPLYLEELARSLTDTLETSVGTVPGSVQGILQTRIDRLAPPLRLALQMAAVLGPQFSVELLHRMYALDAQSVPFEGALCGLEEKGFFESSGSAELRRFRHALMQEVAYRGILVRLRKILHESAAQLGEEHYADRLENEAPFFAHHYWEAELRERAAPHLFRAGMSAANQYDLHAAERWFGQLTEVQRESPEVIPDPGDKAAFLTRYGAVLIDRGRYDASNGVFEELQALGAERSREEWVGHALRCRGNIAFLQGRFDDSRRILEEGLERTPPGAERIRADIHTGLGVILHHLADGEGAIRQFSDALALYESVDDRLGKAKCYGNIGNAQDELQSDREGAQRSYKRALALAEEVGDRRFKTGVLLNLSTLSLENGEWEAALARFRDAEAVAEEIGWSFLRFLSLQNQASCNLHLGRIETAIGLLETCVREGETTMRADDRIRARQFLSHAYFSCYQVARAGLMLEEAKRVANEIGFAELEDALRLDEGRLIAAEGDWAHAAEAFAEALEIATRLGHPAVVPLARAHLYRAACRSEREMERPSIEGVERKPMRALLVYLIADADAVRRPSEEVAQELRAAGEIASELGYLTLERAAFQRAAEVHEILNASAAYDDALRRAARSMAALEGNLPLDLREAFSGHPRNEALRGLVSA